LSKHSLEKADLALTSFLEDEVILRQVKVIRKRVNQYRDLKRSNDDVTPMLIDRLNIQMEVEKLENRLKFEITKREWKNQDTPEETSITMINSDNQF